RSGEGVEVVNLEPPTRSAPRLSQRRPCGYATHAPSYGAPTMNFIDAHVHVWTSDTGHYPLAASYKKADMKPASFTPEDLFKHCKPHGVERINLIQMSFYGFDNSYMLDMIALHPDNFVGTAVIDPLAADPAREMTELTRKGVR